MASAPPRPVIRIGTAGWSYPDWRGIVYPRHKPRGFHELEYLARFFDTVEINTSFYNPPRPEVVKEWIRQIEGKDFQFTAKLWQRFTHDRNPTPEDERVYKLGIAPLAEANRLGAILLQFPWSFKNYPENRQYLTALCQRFREYPLILEVRHSSWNKPEILEMLAELSVGFCNIDQPIIGRSIKPTQHITAPVGYFRLHGRNYKEWFSAKDDAGARYNYLYSLEELEPWVERIKHVADGSRMTFVITNNHARGQAVANALQLTALLGGRSTPVPEGVLQDYPELKAISTPSDSSANQAALPFGTSTPGS
jgi:uncharacterized protein YecE (DUF72 family)